jgi:aryl-alcohol dehydrogenase-like predicted oxidoreductase
MRYNRSGRSGLKIPAVSLGLWHNLGGVDTFSNSRAMVLRAFDLGITHLNEMAKSHEQILAQMALASVLRHEAMTSVLIGASKVEQIEDAVGALQHLDFSTEELQQIETILA